MIGLVWPAEAYLTSYVDALERGWTPDNLRPEAGREELAQIREDAKLFLAQQVDREGLGPPVTLPGGAVVPRLPGYRTVLVAALLWTAPVFLTGRIGQINAYLALAVMVDFVAARRSRPGAGVLTGVAAALKLTPAIAVVAFVACGYRRAAVQAVASAVAVTVLGFAVVFHDSWRYWTNEVFNTHRVGNLDNGFSNSIRKLLTLGHMPSGVQTSLWLVASVVLLVVAFVRARRAAELGNPFAALVIVMCCGLAITPITWSHHLYFFILVLPLLIGDGRVPWRLVCAAAVLVLLFELHNPGQNTRLAEARAVVLPLVVLALPIDRVTQSTMQPVQS